MSESYSKAELKIVYATNHKPKRIIQYNLGYITRPKEVKSNKDGLKNDAPVAWDGTGLTSDQFGPDRS